MSMDVSRMPKLGFGLMRLPHKNGEVDHAQVRNMVDAYMKAGFNYFDTAYVYDGGRSETAIREALVKRYPRDSFFLTDKLPGWMLKSEADRDRIYAEELERCGVEYFDVCLLHSLEEGINYDNTEKYDCFEWLKRQKENGRAKNIGFSFHGSPALLEKILTEHPEIDIVQVQLNYLDWTSPVIRADQVYEILRRHDKPIIVMEPVKGGTLANLPKEAEDVFSALRPDMSAASWALRFVGSLPGVVTILSGMSNEAQMEDNLKTFTGFEPLSAAEQDAVGEVRRILVGGDRVQCTACRYCCDGCPMSIDIPEVFKALNDVRLNGMNDRVRGYYDNFIGNRAKAADCIACGQCESVCPQHLGIISLMKEAAKVFDGVEKD